MQLLSETLVLVLRQPNVDNLIALQEAVLSCLPPSTERDAALETVGHFYEYLLGLQQKLTARQYSELASWLDISAVGLVAFENFLRGQVTGLADLMVGLAAEATMVVASRQYVKVWEVEAREVHEHAAWYLREALWRLSEQTQPDLAPTERLAAMRRLLPPHATDLPAGARPVLLGRLFQMLLLIRIARLLGPMASPNPS